MRRFIDRVLCFAPALALAGCPEADDGAGETEATPTGSTTAAEAETGTPTPGGTETGEPGSTGEPDDTGSESDPSAETGSPETTATESDTGEPAGGVCGQSCAEPADCCPDGVPNCPGDYPFNYACTDGLCEAGGCESDATCDAVVPGWVCVQNADASACAVPCRSDEDCMVPGFACIGEDDSGVTYCAPEEAGGCESDDDCTGLGICDGSSCVCASDTDCTADGVDVCTS